MSPQGGTVTSVQGGNGLTGGGTGGAVTLNVVGTTGGGLTVGADSIGLSTACGSGEVLQWDGDSWECGVGGITMSATANIIPKSDGTNLVASTISDNGSLVAFTTPINQQINASASQAYATQVMMFGGGVPHTTEAVAIVGFVTNMTFDTTSNAIGGQFLADATSNPGHVVTNIAVQGTARDGDNNYSWFSTEGDMRQDGTAAFATTAGTGVTIGSGTVAAADTFQINKDTTWEPSRTVSLGNSVASFAMPGTAVANPSIRVGRSSASTPFQIAVQNTVTGSSETGIAVHVDTTPIATARGGLRIHRGAGGTTAAGGLEIAGGNNSIINGSAANDILVYARQAGARVLLGTGSTPTARMSVDDSGNVGLGLPALTVAGARFHVMGSGGASGITPTAGTVSIIENTGGDAYLSFLNNTNNTGIAFGRTGSAADGRIIYTTGRAMDFYTGGGVSPRCTISSTGVFDCVAGITVNGTNVATTSDLSIASNVIPKGTGTGIASSTVSDDGSTVFTPSQIWGKWSANTDGGIALAGGSGITATGATVNGFDFGMGSGGIQWRSKLATGGTIAAYVGAGTSPGNTNQWLAVDGSGNVTLPKTATITGLLTATAGVTTPANLTTTGTGDLVVADAATIGSSLTIAAGSGTTGGLKIGGSTDALYRSTADGHLYLVNPYSSGGTGVYDIILRPTSTDGRIRLQTGGTNTRMTIAADGSWSTASGGTLGDSTGDTTAVAGILTVGAATTLTGSLVANSGATFNSTVQINNTLSTQGAVNLGNDVSDTVTAVGLAKFGATDGASAYFSGGVLNFRYGVNSNATGYINGAGYQDGTTQTRNLQINDGTGNVLGTDSVAFFDGTDHSTTLYGKLDVLNDLARFGSTIQGGVYFTGGPTGSNSLNFEYGTAAIATGWINRVANAGLTGTFRNLNIGDGKTGIIASFTGIDKSVTLYGDLIVNSDDLIVDTTTHEVEAANLYVRGAMKYKRAGTTYFEWHDDYFSTKPQSGSSGANTEYIGGEMEYISGAIGSSTTSATISSLITTNAVDGHPGIVRFDTGSTSDGNLYRVTDRTMRVGGANTTHTYEAVVRFPVLSSVGANAYLATVGFISTPTGNSGGNGCWFAYDANNVTTDNPTNAHKFMCGCDNTGSLTTERYMMDGSTVSSGSFTTVDAPIVANTWYKLRVDVSDTMAEFYVDDVKSCQIDNMPSGQFSAAGYAMKKVFSTTAVQMDIDYTRLSMTIPAR